MHLSTTEIEPKTDLQRGSWSQFHGLISFASSSCQLGMSGSRAWNFCLDARNMKSRRNEEGRHTPFQNGLGLHVTCSLT